LSSSLSRSQLHPVHFSTINTKHKQVAGAGMEYLPRIFGDLPPSGQGGLGSESINRANSGRVGLRCIRQDLHKEKKGQDLFFHFHLSTIRNVKSFV
jgi:hypothetical protein